MQLRFVSTLFLFFFGISLSLSAQNKNNSVAYIDSLISVKKYDEAFNLCNELLKKDKKNEQVLKAKAFIYLKKKEFAPSIALYKKILSKNSGCVDCYVNIATSYLQQPKKDSALFFINKAIELEPSASSYYITRAEINSLSRADSLYTMADFQKAINLSPTNKEAYMSRARFLFGWGKMDLAKKDVYMATKLDESNTEMLFLNYLIHTATGDIGTGMRYAERVFQLEPDNARMLAFRCALNASAGDTIDARKFLDSLSEKNTNDPVFHIYKSLYFFNAGYTDDYCSTLYYAWTKLKTAVDSMTYRILARSPLLYCTPSYTEYYTQRLQRFVNTPSDYEKALQLCVQGEKNVPESCQLPFLSAYFLLQSGKTQEAFGAIQRSIGKYNREELYRTLQLYQLPKKDAVFAENSFRFKQLFTLQQCLFKMSRTSGANPGFNFLMDKTIDSSLALINFAPDKKTIEDFIYISSDFYYQQNNESKLKKFTETIENAEIKSGIPYLFRIIMLYQSAFAGTYDKMPQSKNPVSKDFPLLKINSKPQKPNLKTMNEILDETKKAIAISPDAAYFFYFRAVVKWSKNDASACEDYKKSVELGLDKIMFPEIKGLCK